MSRCVLFFALSLDLFVLLLCGIFTGFQFYADLHGAQGQRCCTQLMRISWELSLIW